MSPTTQNRRVAITFAAMVLMAIGFLCVAVDAASTYPQLAALAFMAAFAALGVRETVAEVLGIRRLL